VIRPYLAAYTRRHVIDIVFRIRTVRLRCLIDLRSFHSEDTRLKNSAPRHDHVRLLYSPLEYCLPSAVLGRCTQEDS